MVSGVVIRVAAQDVEYQTGKEFSKGFNGVCEPVPYDFSEVFVTGIARHHIVHLALEQSSGESLGVFMLVCLVYVSCVYWF